MRARILLATMTGALALTIATTTVLTSSSSADAGQERRTADQTRAPSSSAGAGQERRTADRTRAFLAAFERKDLDAVSARIDEDATLTIPLSYDGAPEPLDRFVGKEQVLGYVSNVVTRFQRIRFTDMRITVAAHGKTSFAQANGDFTTADGRSYRNVYIYRFDWKNGRMVHTEEYGNPVTLCNTFEDLNC